MFVALTAASVLLMQAAPSVAPTTATQPSATAPTPSNNNLSGVTVTAKRQKGNEDPNEVICHSELPMGSRFAVKVCATRQELNERRISDQMEIRRWTALRPGSGN